MKQFIYLLISTLFIYSAGAAVEVTDTQGRSMEVVVIHYNKSSGNVKIKKTTGQIFSVKLSIFDAESQKRIEEAAPKEKAKLLIDVSVGKRRSRQGDSSYMKDQTISASVNLENKSRDIDFPQGKGAIFLVAQQTRRYSEDNADYGKVLSKQSFTPAILAGESIKFEAQPVITSYDSDRDSSNVGGWEYYGYIFILEDSDGEIHSIETSIALLEREIDDTPGIGKKLLQLKADSLVEKNLESRN
jgi:hypothetical protein